MASRLETGVARYVSRKETLVASKIHLDLPHSHSNLLEITLERLPYVQQIHKSWANVGVDIEVAGFLFHA